MASSNRSPMPFLQRLPVLARGLPAAGLGVLLLALAACGTPSEHHGSADHSEEAGHAEQHAVEEVSPGELTVREARATLMPGMGGIYLTVDNATAEDDRLLSIGSSLGEVTLHETVESDGVLSMQERSGGFAVPAGGTLELAPGGKHGMLMGVEPPGDDAGTIALTLEFEIAGTVAVDAPIVDPATAMADHDGH